MGNLTALTVKNAKPNGQRQRLGDGDGLRLDIDKNGNKSSVFRYVVADHGRSARWESVPSAI